MLAVSLALARSGVCAEAASSAPVAVEEVTSLFQRNQASAE